MNLSFCDSSGTNVLNHQNPNYFLSVFFQQRVVFNWMQPIFRFLRISFFLCCDFNWFREDQLRHNSQIIKTPFAHFLTLSLPSPFVSPLFLFLSRNSSLTLSVSFPLSHHLSLFFPLSLSFSSLSSENWYKLCFREAIWVSEFQLFLPNFFLLFFC